SQDAATFTDGNYVASFDWPAAGYQVRIEAAGYAPFVSKMFPPSSGAQEFNVALSREGGVTLSIRAPDGLPAAGVEVNVCTGQIGVEIENGTMDRHQQPSGTHIDVVKTNSAGRAAIYTPKGEYFVVVVDEKGYLDVNREALAASADLTLQPWGRIEGRLRIGSKPAAGRTASAQIEPRGRRTPPMITHHSTGTADAAGHFAI